MSTVELPRLLHLVITLQERIENNGPLFQRYEKNVKLSLIEPLLRGMGWDTGDPGSVDLEIHYPNPDAFGYFGFRADYMLMSRGRRIMAIEAKKLQTSHWGGSNSVDLVKNEGQLPEKLQACSKGNIRYLALTD